MKKSKVSTFRMQLAWSSIEPDRYTGGRCDTGDGCKHTYKWGRYDRIFLNAARRNVRIIPILLGSPGWAAAQPQYVPMHPSHRRAYYEFARAAAARYGPGGYLWRKNKLNGAALGAKYFQVWNEPNLKNYWDGQRISPSGYAAMLKQTSLYANRGDSSVSILTAGLPYVYTSGNQPAPDFVRNMFKADPNIWRYFTAVAIHPYARTPQIAVDDGIGGMRSTLNSLSGGRNRSIYVTEIGWATGKDDGRFQVSTATQAKYLKEFYDRAVSRRSSYKLLGAVWFNLVDTPGAEWYYRTGLFDRNGNNKPSWAKLKCVTGAPGCR